MNTGYAFIKERKEDESIVLDWEGQKVIMKPNGVFMIYGKWSEDNEDT